MKKTLSVLLALQLTVFLSVAAGAVLMTWEEADQTYWSPDFSLNIDKGDTSEYLVILEDGTISAGNGTGSWYEMENLEGDIPANLITNLNPGWYEAAFYNIGADCTGADGQIAIISRGSSTFTEKTAAAKAGGAVGAIVMNNGKDESIDDVDYVIEGGIGTLGMGMIEETLPCCSVSTDIGIRMLSLIYGIKMADAYDALLEVQTGAATTGLESGKPVTHVFIGTLADYEQIGAYDASKLVSKENALKPDAVLPGSIVVEAPEFAAAALQMPTDMAVLKNDGSSYDDAASAAKALGTNPITAYDYISGSSGNAGEGAKNLWDGDTATKFCTSSFEAVSAVKLSAPASINGIIMATANDNASYNGRNPNEWAIFGSNDGEIWNPIVYGDDTFFDETNFTYYAGSIAPTEAYQYFQFQASGCDSGTFQVSEVVLCTANVPSAVATSDTELLAKSWDTIFVDFEMMVDGSAGAWLADNPIEGDIEDFELRGWAHLATPIPAFAYTIDGGDPVQSEDFIQDRPDVKAAIHEEAEGFDIQIEVADLGAGDHLIKIYAVDANGGLVDTGFDFPFTLIRDEAPAAPAGYPASGESGNFMMGKVIGNETGWDGTAASGAASAFDGNPATFFDPLGVGDGFCGMEYDEPYILEKVAILSRSGWLDRFAGASIEGSNDGEEWETLWESDDVAPSETEYNIVTEFENNYGYKMFRYINWINHGDVAEVEFYGKPGTAERPAEEPKAEEPAPEPEPEPTAAEVVENTAEAVGEAVGEAAENVAEAAENAAEAVSNAASDVAKKSGCGSFIGGGLIVLAAILGSAWISKRK